MSSGPTTVKTEAPPRYIAKNSVIQSISNHTREVNAFLRTSSTKIIVKVRAKPRAPTTTRYISSRVSRPEEAMRLEFHTATDAKIALQTVKTAKTIYRKVARKSIPETSE